MLQSDIELPILALVTWYTFWEVMTKDMIERLTKQYDDDFMFDLDGGIRTELLNSGSIQKNVMEGTNKYK